MKPTRIVLPFRGEFGLVVRFFVPTVHALKPDAVCIEPGTEALFPSAARHLVVDRNEDAKRRDLYSKDAAYVAAVAAQLRREHPGAQLLEATEGMPEARFIPEPTVCAGIDPDVVICPRRRTYGAQKNWPGWAELATALVGKGLRVFAGGAPDSSDPVPCPAAWEYPRYLDATLEAMLAARVVVATDAGLAHLAVLCGRPLVLIAHDGGRVAPGPVLNGDGSQAFPEYWPIKLDYYYRQANHTNAPIRVVPHGWERPEDVLAAALDMAKGAVTA
jgi:hypothetical protein